jgi:hypothetical protein
MAERWEVVARRLAKEASLDGLLGWWPFEGLRRLAFRAADAAHIVLHSPANTALVADCVALLRERLEHGHDEDCEVAQASRPTSPRRMFRHGPECNCGHLATKEALEALDASLLPGGSE